MRVHPDCIICLFQLALRTAKLVTEDEQLQQEILKRLADEIARLPEDTVPTQVGRRIQEIVKEFTNVADPYQLLKRRYNNLALGLYPRLKEILAMAEDPLLTAIRLAIAGNVIDFGVSTEFDLEQAIQESLIWEFAIFDYAFFLEQLSAARVILYLGDNTGEIVFDRLLIEELLQRGKQIAYVVRGGPAINDVTLEDAHSVGLDKLVEVITNGTTLPGVLLKDASSEFIAHFNTADLIIAKGQGNFEGLSDEPWPITFLLKAKCTPIARELGVEPGAMVFYSRGSFELESMG